MIHGCFFFYHNENLNQYTALNEGENYVCRVIRLLLNSASLRFGHKCLRYILMYVQLSQCFHTGDGLVYKEARTRQEATQLIEEGFEYVIEKDGV